MSRGRVVVDPAELFSELVRYETELWNAVEARLRQAHGLDLSWFEPMQVIERTPACRVHDIAGALSITVGGTSKLVDRIEAAGWCQRRPNPDDSRSSWIELTTAGRRLLASASTTVAREVDVHFGSALTPRVLQQFSASVRQLRAALGSRSAGVEPPAPSEVAALAAQARRAAKAAGLKSTDVRRAIKKVRRAK